ncbi:MAG: divalent metal cation transporter [bacterium]|nr:divalent metal cation transporter [bacterium]
MTPAPPPDVDPRIAELEARPFLGRGLGYLRLMGPGYMQSAMTLGGGTAFASIFAGAAFGYELIWVAPLGMLIGIIVLTAVAHQTLSTGQNPFQAMKQHAGPVFAYGWALSGILSSIIWQFAQYALASAMLLLIAQRSGLDWAKQWHAGAIALAWCVGVGLLYQKHTRMVRAYENILKGMVWFIIACFAFVVAKTGVPNAGELLSAIASPSIPGEFKGVEGVTLVVSGLSAAVGANMVFVYPYTLRKKGWGREHRRLARYDLIFGMFIPFMLAASLMLIAAASIFHFQSPELFEGKKIPPQAMADILAAPDRLGPTIGLWVFGLGVVAMALSSITMQMLCSGFALCEMTGADPKGPVYRVGLLLPTIGVLGSVFWSDMATYVAVPTNVVCGFLLPLSYVAFMIMQRKKAYLGDDRPEGVRGNLWLAGMALATLVLVVFLVWYAATNVGAFLERLA